MKVYQFILISLMALLMSSCKLSTDNDGDQMGDTYTWIGGARIVNADGTNDRALTTDGTIVYYANFLPNGEKILIVQNGAERV
jgi:hypothetical protein